MCDKSFLEKWLPHLNWELFSNPLKVHLLCSPMQNSAQCWACSRYWVCICWLSEWITGAEEAEIICSLVRKGSLSIPFTVSSAQPLRISYHHTHTFMHTLLPSTLALAPRSTFFFMDSPEARALPNPFFPGTIWLFCFCNAARVVCQRALCEIGAYSFKPLY